MNQILEFYPLASLISSMLMVISILIMLVIYQSMHGRIYQIIWWSSMLFLIIYSFFHFELSLTIMKEGIRAPEVVYMQFCGSVFCLIVVYAGYRTTTDLKRTNISKAYLDKVMKSMSSYLIVTDANYNVQKINEAFCTVMGVEEKDVVGHHVSAFFFGCNLDEVIEKYSEQKQAMIMTHSTELKPVLLTGESIYRDSGELDGYVFIAFKNYQKEITRLYSYFRSIFDYSEFAIITTDVDGNITGANPAAERYFNRSEDDLIISVSTADLHCEKGLEMALGKKCASRSEYMAALRSKVNEGNAVNMETHMCKLNGASFPALVTLNAIKDDQETIGYFEIIADITEKKRAEEELKQVNAELKDFAHIVSHDLKAPLRAINNLATWISEDYHDNLGEEGKEHLNMLVNRVNRMESLINGILEYSRVGRVDSELDLTDFNEIVKDVKDAIIPRENFELKIHGQLPFIKIDKTRALQIFQNIISNSVKYMDKELGLVEVSCSQSDGFWIFSIADNGPGIDPRYFNKIFQIFQTLRPRDEYESTGVGLAIVKKSVELFGGKVWLESEQNQGANFFFSLPCA